MPTSFIPDTNLVESVNYQMRKSSKTRGHFPDDDSALKLLRLIARDLPHFPDDDSALKLLRLIARAYHHPRRGGRHRHPRLERGTKFFRDILPRTPKHLLVFNQ